MNTTISIQTDVRDDIKEFGTKGETYDEIIRRLLKSAKERQLQQLLMDEGDSVPVKEALSRAKKKMAIVIITKSLEKEINKRLKHESVAVFELMFELENNPKKGKAIGSIGNISIKEIKFKKFRFYFVTDRFKMKFLSTEELKDIFIKFVRMSEKKDQQKTIDEIKNILRRLGEEGF